MSLMITAHAGKILLILTFLVIIMGMIKTFIFKEKLRKGTSFLLLLTLIADMLLIVIPIIE